MARVVVKNRITIPQSFVELQLAQISVDPTEYKPYSHILVPDQPILVRVPINEDDIITKDTLVITLNGLTTILGHLADAIQDMNLNRLSERTRR